MDDFFFDVFTEYIDAELKSKQILPWYYCRSVSPRYTEETYAIVGGWSTDFFFHIYSASCAVNASVKTTAPPKFPKNCQKFRGVNSYLKLARRHLLFCHITWMGNCPLCPLTIYAPEYNPFFRKWTCNFISITTIFIFIFQPPKRIFHHWKAVRFFWSQ